MTPQELHAHVKASLRVFCTSREASGLRALIEADGVENFLTDLLFIELHVAGNSVSREYPIGNRCAADLTVHADQDIHIEAKQLNLKDGCKYVPQNLTNDIRRHGSTTSLGVIYVADERSSTTALRFHRFGGANRRTRHDVSSVLAELAHYFSTIYPSEAKLGLLHLFPEHGGVSLYAFVIADPLLPAT